MNTTSLGRLIIIQHYLIILIKWLVSFNIDATPIHSITGHPRKLNLKKSLQSGRKSSRASKTAEDVHAE